MRRLIPPLLLLFGCGSGSDGLQVSLPAGTATIDASLRFRGIYGASIVGGDGEATILWSEPIPDGSSAVFARSVGAGLELREGDRISQGFRRADRPTGCRHANGLTVAWSDSLVALPNGITLNETDVAAVMSWPPADDVGIATPNTIGQQDFPSVACLEDGRRVFVWENNCIAAEHHWTYTTYFVPEECETEPARGTYLRLFDIDGDGSSLHDVGENLFQWPIVAAANDDRFIVLSGARLQSWQGETMVEELEEADLWSYDAALACIETHCAATTGGQLLLFDAANLASNRIVTFEQPVEPSPDERIYARDANLACDVRGTCVLTWVVNHETWDYDAVFTESVAVRAAAFDIRSGKLGQAVSIREPVHDEFGALVASTGPGRFLLASVLDEDIVVQQLLTD